MERTEFVGRIAEIYGDLNLVHPFREGNGRAQGLLFEHIIISAGYAVDWWQAEEDAWREACIAAVNCDYDLMKNLFEKCIGERIGA